MGYFSLEILIEQEPEDAGYFAWMILLSGNDKYP